MDFLKQKYTDFLLSLEKIKTRQRRPTAGLEFVPSLLVQIARFDHNFRNQRFVIRNCTEREMEAQ